MTHNQLRFTGGALMVIALFGIGATAAGPIFTSTWRSPAAKGASFTGKKVAALVISSDDNLRVSGEEQLARELTALGMVGHARLSNDAERGVDERRAGAALVRARRHRRHRVAAAGQQGHAPRRGSGGVDQPNYSTLWGYYGYGWTTVYVFGGAREETTLVVETLVHSVPKDTLLWAGVSTTTNPKGAQKFITELVAATVKEMKNERLAK